MTAASTPSPTVLVIDDDEFSQEIMCAMLRAHGVTAIQSARNGRQAALTKPLPFDALAQVMLGTH